MLGVSSYTSQLIYQGRQGSIRYASALQFIGCNIDYECPTHAFGGLIIDIEERDGYLWFLTDEGMAFRYDSPCAITIVEQFAYGLDEA